MKKKKRIKKIKGALNFVYPIPVSLSDLRISGFLFLKKSKKLFFLFICKKERLRKKSQGNDLNFK